MQRLIITTSERFVICGLVDRPTYERLTEDRYSGDAYPGNYTIHNARIVINWRNQPSDAKGLAALATHGPSSCLLSPAAPKMGLPGKTIMQVWCLTDAASSAWDAQV